MSDKPDEQLKLKINRHFPYMSELDIEWLIKLFSRKAR